MKKYIKRITIFSLVIAIVVLKDFTFKSPNKALIITTDNEEPNTANDLISDVENSNNTAYNSNTKDGDYSSSYTYNNPNNEMSIAEVTNNNNVASYVSPINNVNTPNVNDAFAKNEEGAIENTKANNQEIFGKQAGPNASTIINTEMVIVSNNNLPNTSTSTTSATTTVSREPITPIVTGGSMPIVSSNPGSPSGGADPFVPIDDYYGLIFLIAISTLIGVFSLKKSKLV